MLSSLLFSVFFSVSIFVCFGVLMPPPLLLLLTSSSSSSVSDHSESEESDDDDSPRLFFFLLRSCEEFVLAVDISGSRTVSSTDDACSSCSLRSCCRRPRSRLSLSSSSNDFNNEELDGSYALFIGFPALLNKNKATLDQHSSSSSSSYVNFLRFLSFSLSNASKSTVNEYLLLICASRAKRSRISKHSRFTSSLDVVEFIDVDARRQFVRQNSTHFT